MKKLLLLCAAVGLHASLAAQNKFTITSEVNGLTEGAKVVLINEEAGKKSPNSILAEGQVNDGKIRLEGQVSHPVLARLSVNLALQAPAEGKRIPSTGVSLMLDNDIYRIVTDKQASDSPFATPEEKGRLRLAVESDGIEQQRYAAYLNEIQAYDRAFNNALYDKFMRDHSYDETTMQALDNRINRAKASLDSAEIAYIAKHTGETMALYLGVKHLDGVYKYSLDRLDELEKQIGTTTDTLRNGKVNRALAMARKYALGTSYADFSVKDNAGTSRSFSSLLQPGKPAVIDMWASWCGPCRSEIPKVREQLYKKYGDKLQIISISVDQKEADWKKAMQEEKMEWEQWIAPQSQMNILAKEYGLQFIPFMIVINDGKIVAHGHTKDLVPVLETLIK